MRRRMAHLSGTSYEPRLENRGAYDILYGEYVRLHDLFGRGGNDVMASAEAAPGRGS